MEDTKYGSKVTETNKSHEENGHGKSQNAGAGEKGKSASHSHGTETHENGHKKQSHK